MGMITDVDLDALYENGYVVIRSVLADDELAHCRAETQRLLSEISVGGYARRWYVDRGQTAPHTLRFLHANVNSFSLRLLAHPIIGESLTRVLGCDFVPYFESLNIVPSETGISGEWRRSGYPIAETKRTFRFEVYLDEMSSDTSRIEVIRGSHVWDTYRKERIGASELTDADALRVEPGDAVVLHGNTLTRRSFTSVEQLRRFVILDFCSHQEARSCDGIDEDALLSRFVLYQYALYQRKIAPYASDAHAFEYTPPNGKPLWTPGEPVDLLADVMASESSLA